MGNGDVDGSHGENDNLIRGMAEIKKRLTRIEEKLDKLLDNPT